jgi:hypothetical protein
MAPRGRTPSLIGGGAGASKIGVVAKSKRTCKRCEKSITSGSKCVEVAKPGTMGHRTYCENCFQGIIAQSKLDLEALETKLAGG